MLKSICAFFVLCGCVYGQQLVPVPPMNGNPIPYQAGVQPTPMAPQTMPMEWLRSGVREQWTHDVRPLREYENQQYYPNGQYYYPQQQYYPRCYPQTYCYPQQNSSWLPYFLGGPNTNCYGY